MENKEAVQMKAVDQKISNHLNEKKLKYLPYHYSLEGKLEIAKDLKKIINDNVPINSPDVDKDLKSKIDKLKDTGIVQFEEQFLNSKQLDDLHDFLNGEPAFPAHVSYYDKYHPIKNVYDFKGKIASFNAETITRAPHLVEMLSNKNLIDLVTAHLGATPTLFDLNLIFSFGDTEVYHETQHFHRDHDDFHHCLLMVYLGDVDEDSGGHIYSCGSHDIKNKSSKLAPIVKKNGSVDDNVHPEDNFYNELVLGKKGTGFVSDANGLHAGSVPKLGKKRMIFWARFGLAKNYMWEVHNHRWWGFDNRLFEKKLNKEIKNQEYIFRLFCEDYDATEAKLKKTIGDQPMKKTSKFGWNIVVFGKNYFGIKQSGDTINIEDLVENTDSLEQAQDKVSNKDILVYENEAEIMEQIEKLGYAQPFLLRENINGHNIVGFGSMVYGIPLELGPVNLNDLSVSDLLSKEIFTGKTIDSVKVKVYKKDEISFIRKLMHLALQKAYRLFGR